MSQQEVSSLSLARDVEGSDVGVQLPSFLRGKSWREEAREVAKFEESKREKSLGFSSAFAGAAVLTNTLLGGSGMLGIPQAFSGAGFVLGTVFLVVFGILSSFGCHLLQCSAVRLGHVPSSFEACSRLVLPWWARWIVDAAVLIKCFGVASSYLIIAGDLLPRALTRLDIGTHMTHSDMRRTVVLAAFLVAGSLACLPRLTALRYTSIATVFIVVWTAILIILFFVQAFDPCSATPSSMFDGSGLAASDWETLAPVTMPEHNISLSSSGTGNSSSGSALLLSALERKLASYDLPCGGADFQPFPSHVKAMMKKLPIFIFGFTCHQNVFSVCNEVKQSTRRRISFVILGSYLVAGTAFFVAALLGYWTFGDELDTDVLKSYPEKSIPVAVTCILFSCVAIFSYPLQIHPSRISALALLRMACREDGGAQSVAVTAPHRTLRYWIVTGLLLSGTCIIAVIWDSLGVVLSIVGATGSTAVTFILPGLIYLNAFQKWHLKRVAALVQLLLGCIIMPVGLAVIFI